MCVVSNLGDYYGDKFTRPSPAYPQPVYPERPVSWQEFQQLLRDVAEMKELLKAAKRIDELTGQPDCELDEKLGVIRKVAEMVGVDLDDVFSPQEGTAQ